MSPGGRVLGLATLGLALLTGTTAGAQPVSLTPGPPSGNGGFLARYRFYLSAESLRTSDTRFDYDADVGGDLDLVDYGVGRVSALANFETILGSQLRRFDPNQTSYALDLAASLRTGPAELSLVLHHISRHLTDRSKVIPVDWNMVGIRSDVVVTRDATQVQIGGRALWSVKRSFVDYGAEVGGRLSVSRRLTPRVALIGTGEAYGLFADRTDAARSAQNGGELQAGVHVAGSRGAVELFVGFERRVDADPFEARALTWTVVGFRLVGGA